MPGPMPDNHGGPRPDFHQEQRPNFGDGGCHHWGDGDIHQHFYGQPNPWNFIAPAIGGFIGSQIIQQQQQAALTAQKLVVNPQTGLQELRSPGYWSIVAGVPTYLPLAVWMN